ncbi:ArsR/SmtB family transcription factor [Chloroflexota bacterium]
MEVQELIQQNAEEQVAVFKALADPTRLRLLKLLCNQQVSSALCVNALAGLLGVTQSAVSQHLRVLKSIGLVRGERRGYHIHYFVNHDALDHCRSLVSATLTIEKADNEEPCERYCPIRREQNVSGD